MHVKTQQDYESHEDTTPISIGKIESTSKKMTNTCNISGIPPVSSQEDSITANDISAKELIFGKANHEDDYESSVDPFSSNGPT